MITKKAFLDKYNISTSKFKKAGVNWATLKEIYADYESRKPSFNTTANGIVESLRSLQKVHSIKFRIKDSEHLIEKIVRNSHRGQDNSKKS